MNTSPNESLRLFIAVDLSAEARAVLCDTQARLQHERLPVRWVDPDGAHITLKYLGDVKADQLETITAHLHNVAAQHQPFTLETGTLGAFPDLPRTRVVWLAVNGERDTLGRLRDDVEHLITPLGFPTEARPFSPHITLGRTHKNVLPHERAAVGRAVREQSTPRTAAFEVNQIVLFRSDPGPAGMRYTALVRAPLAAKA